MRRCHLVEQASLEEGLVYRASEDAASYVELLETTYSKQLKNCAGWLGEQVRERGKEGFKAFVREQVGDWSEAFGPTRESR